MKKVIKIKKVDGYYYSLYEKLKPLLEKKYELDEGDTPDYVFSEVTDGLPDDYLYYPNAIRIQATTENLCADFNVFDYAYGFEDMTFGDRYYRYPLCVTYEDDWSLMVEKHLITNEEIIEKKEFCSFVVSKSTGRADAMREKLFYALSDYKKVNSGGRYLNNIGEPNGVENKLEFQQKHKFALCAENVSHRGYCTEKIVQAFAAKCVPIYWGDPMAKDVFNPKSYIDCTHMKSIDEVVEAVKKVDNDDDLYKEMIKTPALINPNYKEEMDAGFEKFICNIFDQDISKAYRADRVAYGKWHFERLFDAKNVREKVLTKPEVRLAERISRLYRK